MKNKIIPLMIGTYMLLQPAAALAKRYDGPIREISVKVVYDEEKLKTFFIDEFIGRHQKRPKKVVLDSGVC